MKNGCLIDFTSLLLCFDDHIKNQELNLKRQTKMKRMSVIVTDRVKTIINQDTVADHDIDNIDNIKSDLESNSEYVGNDNYKDTVMKSRKNSTAFEFKSQTGTEFHNTLRFTPAGQT